jgi:hypothetical protein
MKRKSLLLTAVTTLGLTATMIAQTIPSYVPNNGLVGWWPFNGNANDESGNGNNGTVNGATLASDRFGVANKAYSFDGVNNLITINAQSTIPQQSDYTLSFWFNSPVSTFNGPFISFGSWFSSLGHDFPGLFYKDEIGNQSNTWYVQQHYFIEPTISVWHNLVIKKTGVTVEIIMDNALIGNITTYGFSNFNPASLIQFGYYCCQNYYEGLMDDFGIWNRALTQQEITDLYNGCPLSVTTQPANQTININNNVQFVAGSSDPNATYQWQTDLGVGFQNLNSVGQYSGTTTNTLTVSNVTMSNNNQPFRCIVNSGTCSDTSDVAVLTVNNNASIDDISQDKLFSIYPNPAQNQIQLKVDADLIGNSYTIIDNTGRIILSDEINSENTIIELNGLSDGAYVMRINDKMNQPFRIIKNQ